MPSRNFVATIDDIKAKIDLVEYLREQGLQLKQTGASFKACCPFHNEKTPSFVVSHEKQVWHCFGCSKGGDLFTFVQEREGLEFAEALKLLAERAGVQLDVRDPRLEGKRTVTLSVLEAAAQYYQLHLRQSDVAKRYVAAREIPDVMVERFQLGYAPDAWDRLSTHLLQKGFRVQEVIESGLSLPGKRQGAMYDRFRHRLMFPIHDTMGRIVGFTARILEGGTCVGEAPAKYINTPESQVYKKSSVIYGLVFAKEAIRNVGHAVLVEGNMDVVASHGAGIEQTVATSGTAFTEQQLRLLARYTKILHIAFDADPAGEGAAERGIDAALDAGFDVRVIRVPVDANGNALGKDPDECIRVNLAAWKQAVAHPIPVLDYYIERVRARFDLHAPAGQRDAGRVLVAHLQHIADPIERSAWVRRAAEVLGVPETSIIEAVQRSLRSQRGGTAITPTSIATSSHYSERMGNRLLALLVRFPEHVDGVHSGFSEEALSTERQRKLYSILRSGYTNPEQRAALKDSSSAQIIGFIERLELYADHEFSGMAGDAIAEEIAYCVSGLRRYAITSQLQRIADRLKALEGIVGDREGIATEISALEQQFHVLTQELSTMH